MILRAFVGSRQRPQHFIIFLYGFRVPEREKLGDLFPVPSGVEDNSRAGTDTPAGGGGGAKSLRRPDCKTTPPVSETRVQKIQRARENGPTAPVLRFCRQYRGRGNLIPAQGNRGGGTGTPPAAVGISLFSRHR